MDEMISERLIKFLKRLAQEKFCEEDEAHCESQSGPYCGTHDFFISKEDIEEAREILRALIGGNSH